MAGENGLPDLYEREEQCLKSIKTLRRAIFMRIAVAVLRVAAAAGLPTQPIVWGRMIFVLLVDVLGAWPLVQEWRRQRALLKALMEQEE